MSQYREKYTPANVFKHGNVVPYKYGKCNEKL